MLGRVLGAGHLATPNKADEAFPVLVEFTRQGQ